MKFILNFEVHFKSILPSIIIVEYIQIFINAIGNMDLIYVFLPYFYLYIFFRIFRFRVKKKDSF